MSVAVGFVTRDESSSLCHKELRGMSKVTWSQGLRFAAFLRTNLEQRVK